MSLVEFFTEAQAGSYMNAREFVSVLEHVYKIKPLHQSVMSETGITGVPAFASHSFFSGHKITSAPFNFYPPLTGEGSQQAAVKHLISLAKTKGPRCYAEYKTLDRLDGDVVNQHELAETIFSIVSEVPLSSTIEKQRQSYKKRHRTKVNKARRELAELEIGTSRDPNDLNEWYDLMLQLYRNKHRMICQPLSLYQRLLEIESHSTLLLARENSRVVGGVFLLHDSQRWDYCWGAMRADFDQRDLASLILDHAISLAIEAEAQTFGFGSSAPSDAPLLFFKQRWGCIESPAYAYYWQHTPKPIDLNSSFSLARQVIAHSPIWLLKAAPPVLVPHLT